MLRRSNRIVMNTYKTKYLLKALAKLWIRQSIKNIQETGITIYYIVVEGRTVIFRDPKTNEPELKINNYHNRYEGTSREA
jgi:hypothetical protein